MATLTLYKGVAFDGINSFPYIPSKSAFDSYLSQREQYTQDIHFNRIGEPILINKGYDTAIEYSYGCIDTGDKKYFIIPDSISVNENNRVYLSYSVDWFTTLEYADALAFGRAHLTKSSTVDPKKYPQAISPMDMTISSKTYLADETFPSLGSMLVSYVDNDKVRFIYSPTLGIKSYLFKGSMRSLAPRSLYNGEFFTLTGILPQDIINAWYIPIGGSKISDRPPGYWVEKSGTLEEGKDYGWYEGDDFTIGTKINGSVNTNITTDNMRKGVIADRNGNIVYVVPYGRTLTKIEYGSVVSITQCYTQLILTFADQPTESTPNKNVENAYVLIPCDTIDYINDTYLNWSMGMKGVEIEERRIQRNKALTQSIGGAALGGAIGASGGAGLGAGIGIAGGIASGLLSYGVDRYYESNTQQLEDKKYQLAQDEIIPGSLILNDGYIIVAYQLSASAEDIARYDDEITNFGADCNLPVASWTPSVGAFKFADVEVIADVPYSIKQNIKQKMQSGIKIVGV